jgi:hypothetical protein
MAIAERRTVPRTVADAVRLSVDGGGELRP